MSDTPRTESFNCYDNGCDNPIHAWGAFSAELERELNAANDRIKRLEKAGDELFENSNPSRWDLPEAAARKIIDQSNWIKAKEAKP